MDYDQANHEDHADRILKEVFLKQPASERFALRKLFDERLTELGLSSFQAEKIIDTDYNTLNRLLNGDWKKYDLINLLKIGYFVKLTDIEMSGAFVTTMIEHHIDELSQVIKTVFMVDHFDLDSLKKEGIIGKSSSYDQMANELSNNLGLSSVMEFDPKGVVAAHSETKVSLKHEKNRDYFKFRARSILKFIKNPFPFDRQGLIEYFPKIRWHSTNVDSGLINVMRSLYKLGVTIVYQPKIPLLQLRGATFAVSGKPGIVLTDYGNSYPTFWFALIHELFHVLFDWDEILQKKYHLSDEETDLDVLAHKEEEANQFAREYLFPSNKMPLISAQLKQPYYVRQFAMDNHVHPSIIYANYAYQFSTDITNYWKTYNRNIRIEMSSLLNRLAVGLSKSSSAKVFADKYLEQIHNYDNA